MRKLILMILLIAVAMGGAVYGAEETFDVNRTRFYYDDQYMWFELCEYPANSNRFMALPFFYWGEGAADFGEIDPVSGVYTVTDEIAFTAGELTGGAVLTGSSFYSHLATDYVVSSYGGEDYTLSSFKRSNLMEGDEYVYYQSNKRKGNPNNKWPYTPKEYVYTASSLEPFEGDSDAFFAKTVEGYFDIAVVNTAAVTDLIDYKIVYEADGNYHIYPITSWVYNEGTMKWDPVVGTTEADTAFAPDTHVALTTLGIECEITSGTNVAIEPGDSFIFRAHGTLSDADMILAFEDGMFAYVTAETVAYQASANTAMGITVVMRAYAFESSYADTAVFFDMDIVNRSGRDYSNFAFGILTNNGFTSAFGRYYDNRALYVADEDLFMHYDDDGLADGVGAWDSTSFGSADYGILGMKILQPLKLETEPVSTARFGFNAGYYGEYFLLQNGSEDNLDITGGPMRYQIVHALDLSGGDEELEASVYSDAATFQGVDTRTDGSLISWEWGSTIWETMNGSHKIYAYEPDYYNDPTKAVYAAYGMPYVGLSNVMMGWYLGAFANNEVADLKFAYFVAPPQADGWTGDYPDVGDPTFDKAMELAGNMVNVYEGGMSIINMPLQPGFESKGYSDFYQDQEYTENTTVQISWDSRAETSFVTAIDPDYEIEWYNVQKFNGKSYLDVLKFKAAHSLGYGGGNLVDFVASLVAGGTLTDYFTVMDEDDTCLEVGSDLLALISEINESSTHTLKLIFKFTDNTYAEFEKYILVDTRNRFGLEMKYIIQAEDQIGQRSSASGDANIFVVPGNIPMATVEESMDAIRVVPNPLYVGTEWDVREETSEVKITNLPAECTVKIYTLNGEILRTIEKNDDLTWVSWDLLTRYNQEVAPGMYIYVVESASQKAKGLFAIIR